MFPSFSSKEIDALSEAYASVYEAIRNPESRKKLRAIMDTDKGRKGDASKGENPRSKYPSERSKQAFHLLHGSGETGSKGNPVRKRGGTNAPADERVGKGPNRAKNAAYWAGNAGPTRDRGAGNKAARRAGKSVPNTRDVDESYDLYDIILSHLLSDGYADSAESATAIMANMSEEWRDSILEAQRARENPEKYEREENKKYEKVRGESRPMPPRGNKDREAFEKWYASQGR
jgi:hypothetical protein